MKRDARNVKKPNLSRFNLHFLFGHFFSRKSSSQTWAIIIPTMRIRAASSCGCHRAPIEIIENTHKVAPIKIKRYANFSIGFILSFA